MRARDLGITIGRGTPGAHNAITDVAGVRVGHTTLIEGDSVRTGVTVVLPHEGEPLLDPLFAGFHRLNGNGEVTGTHWIRESGLLTSVVGLTNTHSVGVVRDALVSAAVASVPDGEPIWSMPVVGETYDGDLNDINGMHVRFEHVFEALAGASAGPVAEGGVGSGTGMICHDFKGGIGTSSRVLSVVDGSHTVGVLVQANHGTRERLRINGEPVGERLDEIPRLRFPRPHRSGLGSIIVLIATDAPLLPGQCERLAQRAALGVGRCGGLGEDGSGDMMLCFATGNRGLSAMRDGDRCALEALAQTRMDALFEAVVDATEEAIVNSMVAATTMHGHRGAVAHRLDHRLLMEALAG